LSIFVPSGLPEAACKPRKKILAKRVSGAKPPSSYDELRVQGSVATLLAHCGGSADILRNIARVDRPSRHAAAAPNRPAGNEAGMLQKQWQYHETVDLLPGLMRTAGTLKEAPKVRMPVYQSSVVTVFASASRVPLESYDASCHR
jgi:hypothetical protein